MSETHDVAVIEGGQVQAARASATPADLVRYAMESGADLDRLEKLMEMQIKWEEREANKAFVMAMADFKRNAPVIVKDHKVEFRTDKGVTSYFHATIGNVVEKIVAGLAEHGFSHRWIPKRGEGGLISITCVITHKLGFSEETTLEAGLDQSGGKNNIQAMISTKTYLERHSLLAATGLATKDQIDDYDDREAKARADEKAKEKAGAEGPPIYPPDQFMKNLPAWKGLIEKGTKTPDQIIAMVSTKWKLDEYQINKIRETKIAQPGEMSESEKQAAKARELAEATQ